MNYLEETNNKGSRKCMNLLIKLFSCGGIYNDEGEK